MFVQKLTRCAVNNTVMLKCASRILCSVTMTTTKKSQHRYFSDEHIHTPRRAVLYVPGNDERKIDKIPSLDVDCAVMDCEDGVALNRKEEARHKVKKTLDEMYFGKVEPVVRINSVGSGLAEEDLDVILQAHRLPPTIMLPKVEAVGHIEWFADRLSTLLHHRSNEVNENMNLIIFVESAEGLLNLRDICQRGRELTSAAPFRMEGIVFGSDDFVADIGATRTKDAKELLYARQKVVVIAKAYQMQAIDLVDINYKDLESLHQQALEGAQMGFTGKQVIHPNQIPVVQAAFTPTPERVDWAKALVKAFVQHQQSGKGAFTFRGNMIDMPLLLQAKNILRTMEFIETKKS